jgi:hypothetical protein
MANRLPLSSPALFDLFQIDHSALVLLGPLIYNVGGERLAAMALGGLKACSGTAAEFDLRGG